MFFNVLVIAFYLMPQFLVIYKLVTLKEFQHETAEVGLLN